MPDKEMDPERDSVDEDALAETDENFSSLASYLNVKQKAVKTLKEELEKNVKRSEDQIGEHAETIKAKADEITEYLKIQLKERWEVRKEVLEKESEKLNDLQIRLHKFQPSPAGRTRGQCRLREMSLTRNFEDLRKSADDCFDGSQEEFEALTTIAIHPSQFYCDIIEKPPAFFFSMTSNLNAGQFRLKLLPKTFSPPDEFQDEQFEDIWLEVATVTRDRQSEIRPKCPRILLGEFHFQFEMGDEMVKASYKDLEDIKNLTRNGDFGFCFRLADTSTKQDVILHVLFGGTEIAGSPMVLSVRHNVSFRQDRLPDNLLHYGSEENHDEKTDVLVSNQILEDDDIWQDVEDENGENVTRSGKNNSQLDESDRRAMGYDTTLAPNRDKLSIVEEVSGENEHSQEEVQQVQQQLLPQTLPNHLRYGPDSSPLVNRHLPLEQPSPLTPNTYSRTTLSNELPPGRTQFTPGVFSTAQNIAEGLRGIEIPQFHGAALETDDNGNISMVEVGHAIAEMQRNLSGEGQQQPQQQQHRQQQEEQDYSHMNGCGANKSVSFHPSTTIYEDMQKDVPQILGNNNNGNEESESVDVNNETEVESSPNEVTLMHVIFGNRQPAKHDLTVNFVTQKTDRSFSAYQASSNGIKVKTGQTKTADGTQAMHKSLLNLSKITNKQKSQNEEEEESETYKYSSNGNQMSLIEDSIWNTSKDAWENRTAGDDDRSERRSVLSDQSNWELDTIEEDKRKKMRKPVPDYDLASDKYFLTHLKSLPISGLPQSVSRSLNQNDDLTFVTDVENNCIHYFKGWQSQGIWEPSWPPGNSFLAPRYVLCIPGNLVVILDNKAMYIFTTNGKLKKKLFDGEASAFRGLAYYAMYGRVITTETTDKVVKLVFVDCLNKNDVVNAIDLEPTREKIRQSKVRFLCCKDEMVFTSDMGLGQVYITKLRDSTTKAYTAHMDGANRLKNAMGVTVDPAENVLVASPYHNKIELFSSKDGCHSRSFSLSKVESPTGICIQGRFLYVVDSSKKTLNIFSVAEKED